MGYLFASFVFGIYVVSLWGALSDLALAPFIGDMMSPIRYSLIAWFLMSLVYLMGQAATKRWNGVVLGGISLATSFFSYLQVMTYLQSIQVPWFVSTLNLEPPTKVLIAAVFGIALLYVVLSPIVWDRYLSQDDPLIIRKFLKICPSLTDKDLESVLSRIRERTSAMSPSAGQKPPASELETRTESQTSAAQRMRRVDGILDGQELLTRLTHFKTIWEKHGGSEMAEKWSPNYTSDMHMLSRSLLELLTKHETSWNFDVAHTVKLISDEIGGIASALQEGSNDEAIVHGNTAYQLTTMLGSALGSHDLSKQATTR